MGCGASMDTDPNILYGGGRPGDTGRPFTNVQSDPSQNNRILQNKDNKTAEDQHANGVGDVQKKTFMKADLTMYTDAKVERDRKLRARTVNREKMAQEMSDHIMEEHERLSLTSSWSRATSRATSPRHSRPNVLRPLALASSPCSEGVSSSNNNAYTQTWIAQERKLSVNEHNIGQQEENKEN